MTRKRFIKLCMAVGVSRNRAREEAGWVQKQNMTAEANIVSVDPIPRIRNISYREHWERAGE